MELAIGLAQQMELAIGIGGFTSQQASQVKKLGGQYLASKVVSQIPGRPQPAVLHAREPIKASRFQGALSSSGIGLPYGRFQHFGGDEPSLPGNFSARVLSEDHCEMRIADSGTSGQTEQPGGRSRRGGGSSHVGKRGGILAASNAVFAAFAGVNGTVLAASDALAAAWAGVGSLQPEMVAQNISERLTLTSLMRALIFWMQESSKISGEALSRGEDDEQIEAVTTDDLDPLAQWGQRKKDVIAEKGRPTFTSPGFSFSAAGLLFPYHLGVCKCLIAHGHITENTPLAGSSAGALVCAVVAGGVSMDRAMVATKELAEDCRASGTAFRLGAVLRTCLETVLPDDVHIRVSGRIRVAITQVFRTPRGLLVDKFDSKEDLVDALFTSCFIPGYLAPRPATIFRDRYCVDGGISFFMPPTAAESSVRICAFPCQAFGLRGIEINPDCNPSDARPSASQLARWALEPPSDDVLDDLFRQGEMDALSWVRKTQEAQRNSLEAGYTNS